MNFTRYFKFWRFRLFVSIKLTRLSRRPRITYIDYTVRPMLPFEKIQAEDRVHRSGRSLL